MLVDGVGRGLPRAVACGKEFTMVATYPYEGPVMEVKYCFGVFLKSCDYNAVMNRKQGEAY